MREKAKIDRSVPPPEGLKLSFSEEELVLILLALEECSDSGNPYYYNKRNIIESIQHKILGYTGAE